MPAIAPIQVSGILKRYLSSEKLSQKDGAELIGVSPLTIGKFLSGRSSPHEATMEKIMQFLQDNGAMTRFGFPTDVPPPIGAVPTPEDTEQLQKMGLDLGEPEMKSARSHCLCGYLSDWDFALFLQSLMNSPMDEQAKRKFLGTLCRQDFPSLA